MSWELFTKIVDQVPNIGRAVLHGVGEPMLVRDLPQHDPLPQGSRHLRAVQHQRHPAEPEAKFQEMIDTGLDELRVSLDAADAKTYLAVRGKDFFNRIVRNVRHPLHRSSSSRPAPPRRRSRSGSPD